MTVEKRQNGSYYKLRQVTMRTPSVFSGPNCRQARFHLGFAPLLTGSAWIFSVRGDTPCADGLTLRHRGALYAVEKLSSLSQVAKKSFSQLL